MGTLATIGFNEGFWIKVGCDDLLAEEIVSKLCLTGLYDTKIERGLITEVFVKVDLSCATPVRNQIFDITREYLLSLNLVEIEDQKQLK